MLCVPASAISASSDSVGVRLLEAPTNRKGDPRARIYIVDHLHPGDTITRHMGVVNDSSGAKTIALYAGAATLSNGAFMPSEGRGGNELASWTTVTPSSVSVPPSKQVVATVKVAVPRDASSGERYGVVWAELRAASSGGTSQVNRVGIRMYISVGSGSEPSSDFAIDSLQAARLPDGTPVVYASVHNMGGRALDVSGSLSLDHGPGGVKVGPFEAKLGTTLGIHQTEPVTVALDKSIPEGPWDATIKLRSGLVQRSAAARIVFPAKLAAVLPPVKAHALSAGRKLVASFLVLVIAACVFVLLLFTVLRRRRPEGA